MIDSANNPVLIWLKSDEDGGTIHKIEVTTTAGKQLIRYAYKAYEQIGSLHDEKFTIDEGKELAMKFIKEFRPDLTEFIWENQEWYLSRYDKGNVDAWVTDDGSHKYGIMVDLNMGEIVHFNREDV